MAMYTYMTIQDIILLINWQQACMCHMAVRGYRNIPTHKFICLSGRA